LSNSPTISQALLLILIVIASGPYALDGVLQPIEGVAESVAISVALAVSTSNPLKSTHSSFFMLHLLFFIFSVASSVFVAGHDFVVVLGIVFVLLIEH
jgi:hypothetical protein